jgi:hypothetical protein
VHRNSICISHLDTRAGCLAQLIVLVFTTRIILV